MKALPLTTATLPPGTGLYRVQRSIAASGPSGHAIGAVHMPPTPGRRGRFDLAGAHVAAFALDEQTAVYETLARSSARAVSLALLGARELLSVRTTAPLAVYDARSHAHPWPFLTAARYAATQDEADEADAAHGLFGVLYASVQRQGAECVALFDKPLSATARVLTTLSGASSAALVSAGGALHAAIVAALVGSQLPLVP